MTEIAGSVQLSRKERKRAFDLTMVTALLVGYLVILLAWYLNVIELPVQALALACAIVTAGYLLVAAVVERGLRSTGYPLFETALQIVAIGALAAVWHYAGGVTNPFFLAVVTIPLATSAATQTPGRTLLLTGVAIVAVSFVALAEMAELGWYFSSVGLPRAWTGNMAGFLGVHAPSSESVSPSQVFVAILIWSLTTLLIVVLLATVVRRRLGIDSIDRSSGLDSLLSDSPIPLAVVDQGTGTILAASERFGAALVIDGGVEGRNLADVLHPRDASVETLLDHGGAIVDDLVIGPETRRAQITARRTRFGGLEVVVLAVENPPPSETDPTA